jgi:hypothetical protein
MRVVDICERERQRRIMLAIPKGYTLLTRRGTFAFLRWGRNGSVSGIFRLLRGGKCVRDAS